MPGERRINPQNPPRTLFGRKKKKARLQEEGSRQARGKKHAKNSVAEPGASSEERQHSS